MTAASTRRLQVGDLADVGVDADGLVAERHDLLLELLGGLGVGDVVDDDVGALLGERQHDGLADAAVAAGDDGDLAFEVSWCAPCSVGRRCADVERRAVGLSCEPVGEVLADADGVGHRGERRVHGADAREEAGVDDVEVVELVGLAVDVEHRRRRVVAEPAGAGLVGHAGDRDVHVHVEVLVEHVVLGHADVVQDLLQLVVEPVGLLVVGRRGRRGGRCPSPSTVTRFSGSGRSSVVSQKSTACRATSARRPVGRQLGELRLLALHRLGVRLADHLDVARPASRSPGAPK